jgi:thioredoxin-like negative regulator of GroEL
MAPVAERVAEMYRDQVHLVKIDVDKHPHMAAEFNIRGVPTLVLTGEKQVIDRQVGAAHLPALTQWLDQHLTANTNEGS